MLLPSLLALHVLTIDLVESVQVGQVSALDIVVQDMHPTLLILIYVIVQVILRGRYHVSNGQDVVASIVVIDDLRMADRNR